MSVATTDHLGMQSQQDRLGHLHELMESPCTNHNYPVNHLYKDYQLLKHLLRETGRPRKEKGEEAANEERGVAAKDPDD